MDSLQDLIGEDSEVSRINFLRDSDSMLPILPSPKVPEEKLEDGLNTPPFPPLHSPHLFLRDALHFLFYL